MLANESVEPVCAFFAKRTKNIYFEGRVRIYALFCQNLFKLFLKSAKRRGRANLYGF